MRYFDTKTKTEVFIESSTTIDNTDSRVEAFFNPLPDNKELSFNDEGLPILISKVELSEEFINIADKISECYQYLSSTDWYYARKMETGEEVPEDVVIKRKEARDLIRENEC